MKRWILPGCLVLVALMVAAVCYWHDATCISQDKAVQLASEYLRPNGQDGTGGTMEVRDAVLATDLFRAFTGNQQWILWLSDEASMKATMGKWVSVDAHTGKIRNSVQGFQEFMTPATIPSFSRFASVLPLVFYGFMTLTSIFYTYNKVFKIFFWVFFGLTCLFFTFYLIFELITLLFAL